MNVRVHWECGMTEPLAHHDRGRLVADTWQSLQRFKRRWDFLVMLFYQNCREFSNGFGFLRTEPTRLNDFADALHTLLRHVIGIVREFPKRGRYTIDHLVGTLCAQKHRDQQCVGVVVVQRDRRFRIEAVQSGLDNLSAFRFSHTVAIIRIRGAEKRKSVYANAPVIVPTSPKRLPFQTKDPFSHDRVQTRNQR